MTTDRAGDLVEFHSEWPWHIHYGTVVEVVEEPREFRSGTHMVCKVRWDGDSYFPENAGTITGVPTWNARLRHRKGVRS